MKFSVVIPAYNASRYLSEAVASVQGQSHKEWELIIVNDGSTDNTKDISDQFAMSDERIKVISKKNAGVSSARNDGISVAAGEFIFFLDADDMLGEDVMSLIANKLETLNYLPDIIFGEYDRFDEYTRTCRHYAFDFGSDLSDVFGLDIWRVLFGKEPTFSSPIMTQIYKTAFLQQNNVLFDPRLFVSEDHDWRYLALTKSNRYYFTDSTYFTYYYRESNIQSVTHAPMNIKKFENSHLYLTKWYEKASTDDSLAIVKSIILGRVAEDYANKAIDILAIDDKRERQLARRLFLHDAELLKHARFRRYKLSNAVLKVFGIRVYLRSISAAVRFRHRI